MLGFACSANQISLVMGDGPWSWGHNEALRFGCSHPLLRFGVAQGIVASHLTLGAYMQHVGSNDPNEIDD